MKTLEEKLRLIVTNSKMGVVVTYCESAGYQINSRGNQYTQENEHYSGFHPSVEGCADDVLEMMDRNMVSKYGPSCVRVFLV